MALTGIVALLALAIIGLLIGVIILGVQAQDYVKASAVSRQGGTIDGSGAPGAPASDSGGAVYLSTNNVAPEGFEAIGALGSGSGSWVDKTYMPADAGGSGGPRGRSDGSAVSVDSRVYYIGGVLAHSSEGNVLSKDVLVYDALLDTFSAGPDLPVNITRGSAAYDGESKVYYVAGAGDDGVLGDTPGAACVFFLDTSDANATWVKRTCTPTPRSDHCSAWVDGKLYVIGGYDGTFATQTLVEVFEPATNKWTQPPELQLPDARGDVACTTLGQQIYVIGGVNVTDWENTPYEDYFTDSVIVVDVGQGSSGFAASMPHRRGDVAAAALSDDSILVIGGETFTDGRTQVATHEVSMYIASQNLWVEMAPISEPRFRASAAAVQTHDGAIAAVVLGGHHRCERMPDYADASDDGGCDESHSVEMFLLTSIPHVFAFQATDALAAQQAPWDDSDVLLSLAARVSGYEVSGTLDQGRGYWTDKADMSPPRSDFHAYTVVDKIYLVGGQDSNGNVLRRVDVYDPELDVHTTGTDMKAAMFDAPIRYAGGAHSDGKIYLASGINKSNNGTETHVGTLRIFDTASSSMTTSTARMSTPRSDACGGIVNGKLYVAGGYDADYTILSSVEVYDIAADTWSAGPDLPEPRGDCSAAVVDGQLYVTGGYYDPSGSWQADAFHSSLWALDASGKSWSARAPMPSARGDRAATAAGDVLLVMGGETHADNERTKVATHDVYEYIPSADVWLAKSPLPEARFRAAAASYEGFAYIFGGHATCTMVGEVEDNCADGAHHTVAGFYTSSTVPLYLHVKS